MSRPGPSRHVAHRAIVLLSAITVILLLLLWLLPRQPRGPDATQAVPEAEGAEGVSEEAAAGPDEPVAEAAPADDLVVGRLAFVIDDAGNNDETIDRYLAYPGNLTISVLPRLPASSATALRAVQAGKDVILHCPMEPLGGANTGPGAIRTDQSAEEIRRILHENYRFMPQAIGLNNHMGSRATADEFVMNVVMTFAREEGIFFLDSKTSPDSVAGLAAARHGVLYLERDVFLDNVRDRAEIEKWVVKGKQIAAKRGYAVLIGHAMSTETIDVLESMYDGLAAEGFRMIGLAELAEIVGGAKLHDYPGD